jgi:hypothetical protein
MTRTYALLRLLELGPLTRKEIREITGWPEQKLRFVLHGQSNVGKVQNHEGIWYRRYEDGSLQTETV